MKTSKVVRVSVIAALYAVVTVVFAPLSYGLTQVRISEALTVLPFIFPESVMGLFLGCFIANIYGGLGIIDVVFGSLATLIAAFLTSKMPSPLLAPLPPVLVNAVIIAYVLYYTLGYPLLASMLYVGIGQFLSCYLIGLPLLFLLKKYLPK
ncbi:MAG: QueT transporter family protein [Clostridia bacterium]|jgi:uncharacterized membrane protein|nr:QueT transporter family protein [Clostridia bacterium]